MKPTDYDICTRCGTYGLFKEQTKGYLAIEIILWCLMILPGMIYTIWRLTTRRKYCSKCGSDQVIPLQSPIGKELKTRYYSKD